jgi:hypothetical protein
MLQLAKYMLTPTKNLHLDSFLATGLFLPGLAKNSWQE